MLAEIAVKNMLLQLSKRTVEIQLDSLLQRKGDLFFNLQEAIDAKLLDIKEYETELFFHKKIADKNEQGGYQILVWDVLPYRVPVATQSAIAMIQDMHGNRINDVYNFDSKVRMQYIHICVFPMDGKSVILAFYHKRDKLYQCLRHQINSSSKEATLKYLNYLIFAYTENFFISKKIHSEVQNNKKLQELCQENNGFPGLGILGPHNMFGIGYTPITVSDIPNFLSSEWAI